MPKRPAQHTSTGSPGASTETSAASIAEREVPSTTIVCRLAVLKMVRNMACTSPITLNIYGSNWPTVGLLMAVSTRGSTFTGPGAMSRRCGGLTGAMEAVSMVVVAAVAVVVISLIS